MPDLKKVAPIHPNLIAPRGAVATGETVNGIHTVFKLVRKRNKSVPKVDPKTGERAYRISQITGEQLYPLREKNIVDEEVTFYLHSQGNGNVEMVPYRPPTEEEKREQLIRRQAAQMVPQLTEELARRKITPAQLLDALFGGQRQQAPPPPPEVAQAGASSGSIPEPGAEPAEFAPDFSQYPLKASGVGRWELSSGEIVKGNREAAEQAEAKLQQEQYEAQQEARANLSDDF